MNHYDWIVVGAGITGAALSYELRQRGFAVLLLDQFPDLREATRYSYGGISYWAGTTDLTRTLCRESFAIHRQLSDELDADTQFQIRDLLLTIAPDADPQATWQHYQMFDAPPDLLTVAQACACEPLLNPAAIAGALLTRHGHVSPEATAHAYRQAFVRQGGTFRVDPVTDFVRATRRITGVVCQSETLTAERVVVCTGALTRSLLAQAGITVPVYFTHAELLELPPVDWRLRCLLMPAENQRLALEATATTTANQDCWDQPGQEPVPPILDAGIVQFQDGRLRLGQVSRVLTDVDAALPAEASATLIREQTSHLLPILRGQAGSWHHCRIAFSQDQLPLVGAIADLEGLYLFSGFSNPFALIPTVARRFAQHLQGTPDPLLPQLSPNRFAIAVSS